MLPVKNIAGISGVLLTLAASQAYAHGKASGIVKERMDLMVAVGDAMKVLKVELALGGAYDPVTVTEAASAIRSHSGEAMTKLFPEGSTMHSEALPSVWEKPDRFAELAGQLEAYAGALETAARSGAMDAPADAGGMMGGPAELPDAATLGGLHPGEAFRAVTNTCSACHTEFRKKKEH